MASFGRPVGESTYIHTNFILVPKRLFREYMLRDKNEVKLKQDFKKNYLLSTKAV